MEQVTVAETTIVDMSQRVNSQQETLPKKNENKKGKSAAKQNTFISPQDSMFINQISYLTQVNLSSILFTQ